jgi:lipopolysaccharide transport system ATP-binding protein
LKPGAGFNPDFTGRQNAVLNAQILGLTQTEIDERLDDIEAFADIGAFFDQPVKTYSSGMYVRVAFAVQACIDPDILVVDEALAVGDEKFQRKCYDRLEQLRLSGTSILLVTHSTTAIERFCQRAVLLHQGVVHGVGASNVIVDQYHALLYADDAAYIKYLNSVKASHAVEPAKDVGNLDRPYFNSGNSGEQNSDQRGVQAFITQTSVSDASGTPADVFHPSQRARFSVHLRTDTPVAELQVGISIRTVEGVHAFGTSTLYSGQNIRDLPSDTTAWIEFEFDLNLGPGVYFVSFALAEPTVSAGMRYVDKRTDALLIRVAEPRVSASGIAYMRPTISEIRN